MNKDRLIHNTITEEKFVDKYIIFRVSDEKYAIRMMQLIEIRSYQSLKVSYSASLPSYIIGVCEFKDEIVPLINLRVFFDIDIPKEESYLVALFVLVNDKVFGLLVDDVFDIVQIEKGKMNYELSIYYKGYIESICSLNGEIIFIINLDKLMSNNKYRVDCDDKSE